MYLVTMPVRDAVMLVLAAPRVHTLTDILKDTGVQISMDGRERSMKYECIHLHAFETGSELRAGLAR